MDNPGFTRDSYTDTVATIKVNTDPQNTISSARSRNRYDSVGRQDRFLTSDEGVVVNGAVDPGGATMLTSWKPYDNQEYENDGYVNDVVNPQSSNTNGTHSLMRPPKSPAAKNANNNTIGPSYMNNLYGYPVTTPTSYYTGSDRPSLPRHVTSFSTGTASSRKPKKDGGCCKWTTCCCVFGLIAIICIITGAVVAAVFILRKFPPKSQLQTQKENATSTTPHITSLPPLRSSSSPMSRISSSSASPPVTTTEEAGDTFNLTLCTGYFHIVGGVYSTFVPELLDPSSEFFKVTALHLEYLIDRAYKQVYPEFDKSHVLQFHNGSIAVLYSLRFSTPILVRNSSNKHLSRILQKKLTNRNQLGSYVIDPTSIRYEFLSGEELLTRATPRSTTTAKTSAAISTTKATTTTTTTTLAPVPTTTTIPRSTTIPPRELIPVGDCLVPSRSEFKHASTFCSPRFYSHVGFPSYFGDRTRVESSNVDFLLGIFNDVRKQSYCHQQMVLFLCSIMFPKCDRGITHAQRFPPCRRLCFEVLDQCLFFFQVKFKYTTLHRYLSSTGGVNCTKFPDINNEKYCIPALPPSDSACAKAEPTDIVCDSCKHVIPRHWKCDGVKDCEDGSDEKDCNAKRCPEGRWPCSHTQCIPNEQVCDGTVQCINGKDEKQCAKVVGDKRVLELFDGADGAYYPLCYTPFNGTGTTINQSLPAPTALGFCNMLGYDKLFDVRTQESNGEKNGDGGGGNKALKYHVLLRPVTNLTRPHAILTHVTTTTECGSNRTVLITCDQSSCGLRNPSLLREPNPGDWPWVVTLHGGPQEKFYCSGFLIHPKVIITAGHCIGRLNENMRTDAYRSEDWTLRFGTTRLLSHTNDNSLIVQRVHPNPSGVHKAPGSISNSKTVKHDLAFIALEKGMEITNYVRPICLPPEDYVPPTGRLCAVAGFGKLNSSSTRYNRQMREVEMKIVNHTECKDIYEKEFGIDYTTDDMICAISSLDKDVCLGDSGSVLACPIDLPNAVDEDLHHFSDSTTRWYAIGVLTYNVGCRRNAPAVFMRVSNYLDFIETKLHPINSI